MFVSLQINLYICNVASCMRQDIIRKRFWLFHNGESRQLTEQQE